MKKSVILFVIVFISSVCFADTVFVHSTVVIPDSVVVKSLKHPFWDNLPSIILGLISLTALIVAYINTQNTIKAQNENFEKQLKAQEENLARQLKAQVTTTIEKEWIKDVRGYLATVILHFKNLAATKQKMGREEYLIKVFSDHPINVPYKQLIESTASLRLLLNSHDKLEKELWDKIYVMPKLIADLNTLEEVENYAQNVIDLTHQVFSAKLNK